MAARFWVNGGSNNNWNDTSNWALTSGGAGGQTVPTSADDVTLDAGGNVPCILNAVAVCLSFTVTAGYTSTVTFTNSLTNGPGNLTLGANMGFAGSGAIITTGTVALYSNGKTCPQPLTCGGTVIISGGTDWTNTALVSTAAGITHAATEKMYVSAGLSCSGSLSGAAVIVFNGPGTFTVPNAASGQVVQTGLTFAMGAGNTLVITGSIKMSGSTQVMAYVSGNISWPAGFQLLASSSFTMDNWATVPIPSLFLTATVTVTITTTVLPISGTLSLPAGTSCTFAGAFGWVAANVTRSATTTTTLTLKDGVEYVATSSFSMGGYSGGQQTITSSHAANLALLTIKMGCAYDLSYTTLTRLDFTNGVTTYASHGILTSCVNAVTTAMPLWFSNFNSTLLTWGNGQQGNVLRVKCSNVFGGPITGLTYSSPGLCIATFANVESAATIYKQTDGNIEGVTTLGTFQAPSSGHCRFREVDPLSHPGEYELHFADARYAVAGATALCISLYGAPYLAQGDCVVELVGYKPQDPSLGMMLGTLKKNVAFPNFTFPMFDSGGLLKTGLTVTSKIRKDTGSFATIAGTVTEIGTTGWYTVDLAQAETNATVLAFSATASGAVPTCTTILTQL